MAPERMKNIRHEADLSVSDMAALLGLSDPGGAGGRRVREMEGGKRTITGPVAQILRFLDAGYLGDPYIAMTLGDAPDASH